MTREEHMDWCKARALEYLPNDPGQAVASMIADLGKHEDTRGLLDFAGPLGFASAGSAHEARKFIKGFA